MNGVRSAYLQPRLIDKAIALKIEHALLDLPLGCAVTAGG